MKLRPSLSSMWIMLFCCACALQSHRVEAQDNQLPGIAVQPQGQTNIPGPVTFSVMVTNSEGQVSFIFSGSSTQTNVIATGSNFGTLVIAYDFYTIPDRLLAYYEGALVFDSGLIKGAGLFSIHYGPGNSTNLLVVMNPDQLVDNSTLWKYGVSGIPPWTYQWTKDGSNIPRATDSTFTITNAQPEDSGTYRVIISNALGELQSDPAVLQVNPVRYAPPGPAFDWVVQAGGLGQDNTYRLALDQQGNAYLTGGLMSPANFGTNVVPAGGFLAKYDRSGHPQWVKPFSAAGSATAVDGAGNCFVAGTFSGISDFSGLRLVAPQWQSAPFVAKYNSLGDVLWVRAPMPSPSQSHPLSWGIAIAADAAGNSYVSGTFQSTNLDFAGVSLTNRAWPWLPDTYDLFVAKYDPQGILLWAKSGGSTYHDEGRCVGLDAQGNVFVAGYVGPNADFDGSPISDSKGGGVLAKFDTSGRFLWARVVPGSYHIEALAVSTNGNCVVWAEPGLLAKYDSDGDPVWQRQAVRDETVFVAAAAQDRFGNCYVVASFTSTNVDFVDVLLPSQNPGAFVAKYGTDGTLLWVKPIIGAGGQLQPYGLAVDDVGRCYLSGYFGNTALFDDFQLSSQGLTDIFLARLASERPELQWSLEAGSLVLKWPAGQSRWVLETTSDSPAANSNWSEVQIEPTINGDQNLVSITSSVGPHFYRLRSLD